MQFGPGLLRTNHGRWEDHSVERDVVLAHELVELDILLVLPPLLPLVGVGGCNRDVTNRGIEPDIEDLLSEFLDRDRRAPLKVASDASTE